MFRSLVFLKNAILRFGTTGAVWPSSRFLAKAMAPAPRHRGEGSVVIEIGPGTGSLTRAIVAALEPGSRLILIDLNEDFIKILRKRFPDVEIVLGDAQELTDILRERGIEKVDCVVSGLPFTNFPQEVSRNILNEVCTLLKDDGELVLFQYIHSRRIMPGGKRFFKMLTELFPSVTTQRVFLNIPSAYVYRLRRRSPRLLKAPQQSG